MHLKRHSAADDEAGKAHDPYGDEVGIDSGFYRGPYDNGSCRNHCLG